MRAAITIMAGLGGIITIIKRILSETMPRETVIMTHSALGLAMPRITTIRQGTRLNRSVSMSIRETRTLMGKIKTRTIGLTVEIS